MQADSHTSSFISFNIQFSHNGNKSSYWFSLQCFSFGWDKNSNIWLCNIIDVTLDQYFNEDMGNYENPQTSMVILVVKIYQYIRPWLAFNNVLKVFLNTIGNEPKSNAIAFLRRK